MPIDVIYPVRPGDHNPELRYSLRALETNHPNHGDVWIVGHKPDWLTGIGYIPGNNNHHTRGNLWTNLIAACEHPAISEEIVIMNDDFFITEPIDEIPTLYRGPLVEHLGLPRVQRGEQWWRDSLRATLAVLQALGHSQPASYELHVPFRANKAAMLDTLQRFAGVTPENPPQWRTLHGNLHNIGGQQHSDGKAYRSGPITRPFHSTDDRTWRYFANQLRDMFPQPSRYEVH